MMNQQKQAITPGGREPASPYSAGLVVGETVYVSGQGPLDPETGKIVGTTIEEQTELTLNNVKRILEAAGCSMDDCVKSTVHLKNMDDFDRFNAAYRKFFNKPYPVRTTVQSVLWGGILVEIDVIAFRGCAANKG